MIDFIIGVPVLVAMTEMSKLAGLPSKYAPLTSVLLGVVLFGFFCVGVTADCIFQGLIAGLSASGLYSGVKASAR